MSRCCNYSLPSLRVKRSYPRSKLLSEDLCKAPGQKIGTKKTRPSLGVAFPGWISLSPLSPLEYRLLHVGLEFPSKLERTSPDQVHEGISRGNGLDPALSVQPLLGALPRMDDGDHEDADEDRDDSGHHVVYSCPHPHPPCCLVIQGRHTWRTGGAARAAPSAPHHPLSHPFAPHSPHCYNHSTKHPSPFAPPHIAILQLPFYVPNTPSTPSFIPSTTSLTFPLFQASIFNPHSVLYSPLFCTISSSALLSSSSYPPQNHTSLQPSSLYTICSRYFWSPIKTPFIMLIHPSFHG